MSLQSICISNVCVSLSSTRLDRAETVLSLMLTQRNVHRESEGERKRERDRESEMERDREIEMERV